MQIRKKKFICGFYREYFWLNGLILNASLKWRLMFGSKYLINDTSEMNMLLPVAASLLLSFSIDN